MDSLSALWQGISVFLRTLWRVTRQVFHETVGALFAFFALSGGLKTLRSWRNGEASWLLGISLVFVVMMGSFAVVSFRSARRVR